MNKRSMPPDVPGVYFMQDDQSRRTYGEKAFLIAIVNEVRDASRYLFASYNPGETIDADSLVYHLHHPPGRYGPVSELNADWWGPVETPGDL